jgi:tRNA A-37 threonylcarbamoyl transferase component Bud32
VPDAWGDYVFVRLLRADATYLARDPLGRDVVLKKIPSDCLRRGGLHASVRDRLERLREAPTTRFVGPMTAERLPAGVMLVSPFVPGTPLATGDAPRYAGALRRAVADLHACGLAHGAIHAGNVIASGDAVTLIDASPFLHDDFAADLAAVDRLVGPVVDAPFVAAALDTAFAPGYVIAAAATVAVALTAAACVILVVRGS